VPRVPYPRSTDKKRGELVTVSNHQLRPVLGMVMMPTICCARGLGEAPAAESQRQNGAFLASFRREPRMLEIDNQGAGHTTFGFRRKLLVLVLK